MTTVRMFPIMNGPDIPWSAIAPFEHQAKSNHGGQTLEKLARRGGLSVAESIAVMRCEPFDRAERHPPLREQIITMLALVAQMDSPITAADVVDWLKRQEHPLCWVETLDDIDRAVRAITLERTPK